MRRLWLVLTFLAGSVLAQPEIRSAVTDLAGVLSAEKKEALEAQLRAHQQKTGVQLAVLTVDTTGGEPIETWSLRAAVQWGGGDKRRDDGGLFVLAVKDRKMRIELGYGLEGRMTDGEAERLLATLRPALVNGDYDAAVQQVVDGLVTATQGGLQTAEERERAAPLIRPEFQGAAWYVLVLLVFGVIGRVAKSRLQAEGGPSRSQVGLFLAVLVVAVDLGFGFAGIGWFYGWAAVCGAVAGLTFFLSNSSTLVYPFFLGLFSVFGLSVGWILRVHPLLHYTLVGLGHLAITWLLGRSAKQRELSLDALSARTWGTRHRLGSAPVSRSSFRSWWSASSSRSRSSSSFGSSSSSSSSRSSSRGYSGGGGGFGGGGASSGW